MKSYLSELGEPWWSAPGAVSHFANPDPAEDSIHLHASFASEYFAFLPLSLSSWSFSSLTPASHFSHFALPLSVPPTYTHRKKTLGAGYKKYSEKVTKLGICLLLLCSSVFCLRTKTFTAPYAVNAHSETPYLSVTLTRSLSLAPSQTFPTPPSLEPPPPLLPSSSRSLSSCFIFHHHPPPPPPQLLPPT